MDIPDIASESRRLSINAFHAQNGVVFVDPYNTYIGPDVKIGKGTVIYPNVCIEGKVLIGENTIIHMGCSIKDTVIGNECVLRYVVADTAEIGNNVKIGPFVNLRPNTHIQGDCKIGDFVEIKNSNLGLGSKAPHLSYIGDADVGSQVNIGCGAIFVNYDGIKKHRTHIGDRAFIGCNTNLIAPLKLGSDTFTAAGSTITRDVPDGALSVERGEQKNIAGWVERMRSRKGD